MLKRMLKRIIEYKSKLIKIFLIYSLSSFTPSERMVEISESIEGYSNFVFLLETNYFEKPDHGKILEKAIEGVIKNLDEESSILYEEKENDRKEVGIDLCEVENRFFVERIHQNSSAIEEKIHIGTEILEINGKKISPEVIKNAEKNNDILELTTFITDQKEKRKIKLKKKIFKKGLTIKELMKEGILFLKIENFEEGVAEEVEREISQNYTEIKGVIFDLRGNGGGFLNESLKILYSFIPGGVEILKTSNSQGKITNRYLSEREDEPLEVGNIIVLVDEKTASAAEIFAGIIQDLDLGIVIGNRTYGKGSVQIVKEIFKNKSIRLTTGRYILPKGRKIKKENGIVPDIIIKEEKFTNIIEDLKKKKAFNRFIVWFYENNKNIGRKNIFDKDKIILEFCNWALKNCGIYEEKKVFEEIGNFLKKIPYNDNVRGLINQAEQATNKAFLKDLIKEKISIKKCLEDAVEEYKDSYEVVFMKKRWRDPVFLKAIEEVTRKKEKQK